MLNILKSVKLCKCLIQTKNKMAAGNTENIDIGEY